MAMMAISNSSAVGANGGHQSNGNSSPLCRCRVLYIGSAVPTVTKDGLQGIQQPLRERYPAGESPDAKGIDSWLSVWYNGLLLEYVDGEQRTESAFFPINTLHYCAAVRYVNMGAFTVEGGGGGERFIPLDSPFAMGAAADSPHPPIFAAIFRRTTGVKVLECHGFVCTNEKAANALVRCCFHAYADTMYLKLDEKLPGALTGTGPLKAIKEPPPPSSRSVTPSSELNLAGADEHHHGAGNGNGVMPLMDGTPDWNERAIGQKQWQRRQQSGEYDAGSVSSSLAKKGGMAGGRPRHHHQEMVPYMGGGGGGGAENGGGYFTSRRTASHAELRSSAQNHPQDFFDASSPYRGPPRHPAGPPFFFGPHPPPPHPFFHPGPPPGMFLRPPPPPGPPFPPHPAHFFPPRPGPFPPHGLPPHFGRMIPPPPPPPPHPFMMRPPFFMMPPHFMGLHHGPPNFRPKSPERTGGGPIITDYDTFPRHNRTTYEEPIYMPSATNPLPPYASYKPGSFSPELYEHYYETYKQQNNNRGEMERKNVSRSNSDISGDYWESAEQNAFGRKGPQQRMNERAFANTLLANQQQPMTNKMANGNDGGSPMGTAAGTRRGMAGGDGTLTKSKPGTSSSTAAPAESAPGTSNGGGGREPKPDTPPADYELTAAGEMRAQGGHHRMTAY